MSCIRNIQNTYQNSLKAYILRRLKRDIASLKAKTGGCTCSMHGHERGGNVRLTEKKRNDKGKKKRIVIAKE